MSLTPTDDPDSRGEPQRPVVADETDRSQPSLRRRLSGVRARLSSALRRTLTRTAAWFAGGKSAETPALADGDVEAPTCPPVDGLPARKYPLTYPTRASTRVDNDTDLVGTCDGETMRLEHPDAPETAIESDTWVPIER